MSQIHSYPKVYNLGHAAVRELLLDTVIVEEKVDGSQFSFGLVKTGQHVEDSVTIDRYDLQMRSHQAAIDPENPPKMFKEGVELVRAMAARLTPGYVYRGEYLSKPKHNTLAYDRIPLNNIIIFDINDGEESYLSPEQKDVEAARLGFEVVPVLLEGALTSYDAFASLLETVSILGGQKVEGVVIKNYSRFGRDGKALMGKFVSEAFKEKNGANWKSENPGQRDIITRIAERYKTPARWDKAIQHLAEQGVLTNEPKDIGPLFKEVQTDTLAECGDEIREELFRWAWRDIGRQLTAGLAEYYKERLARQQFETLQASAALESSPIGGDAPAQSPEAA